MSDINRIDQFDGRYYFLSNFYASMVTYDGLRYLSAECAFQAQKCINPDDRDIFTRVGPSKGKYLGRRVTLRSDWENVKLQIMENIVRAKFTQNENLRVLLINTGDKELVEGNTWNDKFWGVDANTGVGENHLGKILMKVRKELQQQ